LGVAWIAWIPFFDGVSLPTHHVKVNPMGEDLQNNHFAFLLLLLMQVSLQEAIEAFKMFGSCPMRWWGTAVVNNVTKARKTKTILHGYYHHEHRQPSQLFSYQYHHWLISSPSQLRPIMSTTIHDSTTTNGSNSNSNISSSSDKHNRKHDQLVGGEIQHLHHIQYYYYFYQIGSQHC
jgi:hypothetical protein